MIPAICSAPHVTADSTESLLIRIFCSTSTTTSELWMVAPLGLIFQVAPSWIVLPEFAAARFSVATIFGSNCFKTGSLSNVASQAYEGTADRDSPGTDSRYPLFTC